MSDLRTRLVLAALDVLREDDPMLIIGIADTELRLSWQTDLVRTVLEKIRDRADDTQPDPSHTEHT